LEEKEEAIKGVYIGGEDEDMKIIISSYIALKMNEEKFCQEL
jgi:hypothetical protein